MHGTSQSLLLLFLVCNRVRCNVQESCTYACIIFRCPFCYRMCILASSSKTVHQQNRALIVYYSSCNLFPAAYFLMNLPLLKCSPDNRVLTLEESHHFRNSRDIWLLWYMSTSEVVNFISQMLKWQMMTYNAYKNSNALTQFIMCQNVR